MRESLTPALLALILACAAPLKGAEPAPTAPPPAVAEPTVPAELKTLVDRQRALLAQADKAADQAGVEELRPDFQRLVVDYEQFLKDHPDVAAGYVSYALLLSRPVLGERERAAALLLKANQHDPNQPLVKNQLGNYLAEDGKPLQAVNYFLAAIRLAPDEPLYHYQLGTLLAVARDDFIASGEWKRPVLDDAMQEAFHQATTLAPGNVEYALAYGKSFYDLERPDWEEALKYWRALELRIQTLPLPKPALIQQTIHLYEAKVLLKQGRLGEARTLLDTVDDLELATARQALAAELAAPPAPAASANITVPAVGVPAR
jgi:tetratricopeptide (TPR) repeat protein